MKQQFTPLSLYEQIRYRKTEFLGVFFVVTLCTYGLLFAIDFVPSPAEGALIEVEEESQEEEEVIPVEVAEEEPEITPAQDPFPTTIHFDSLGKQVEVLNPDSRSVADLDAALLNGVVRHPDSATLTEEGNIFILGHSSYLPNVLNKNYQAFNGIQDLSWGDTIRVRSNDAEYTYRVQKVYQAKATEVVVPTTPGKAQLTLATCNSFGSKDDRFIVEASLISTEIL